MSYKFFNKVQFLMSYKYFNKVHLPYYRFEIGYQNSFQSNDMHCSNMYWNIFRYLYDTLNNWKVHVLEVQCFPITLQSFLKIYLAIVMGFWPFESSVVCLYCIFNEKRFTCIIKYSSVQQDDYWCIIFSIQNQIHVRMHFPLPFAACR